MGDGSEEGVGDVGVEGLVEGGLLVGVEIWGDKGLNLGVEGALRGMMGSVEDVGSVGNN